MSVHYRFIISTPRVLVGNCFAARLNLLLCLEAEVKHNLICENFADKERDKDRDKDKTDTKTDAESF